MEPDNHVEDDFGSEAELQFLTARNNVSDVELLARVREAPDMGGAALVELMACGEAAYEQPAPETDEQAHARLAAELLETATDLVRAGVLSVGDVAKVEKLLRSE